MFDTEGGIGDSEFSFNLLIKRNCLRVLELITAIQTWKFSVA